MTYRVLVLCHGNINRSALAHVVLVQELEKLGSEDIEVSSAGFVNPGRRAAKKMRDAAEVREYSLEEHRSTLVTEGMVVEADLVIIMDNGNLTRLDELMKDSGEGLAEKIGWLGSYAKPPVEKIVDPAYMKRDSVEFNDVANLIVRATRNLAKELIGQQDDQRDNLLGGAP